jgi:uncharacterized protein
MTPTTILLLAAIYVAASFVQGLTGFGMGLIAVPLIALMFGPQTAVGMVLSVGIAVGLINFLLHRKQCQYRRVLPLALLSYPFVPLGVYFLENVDADLVMIILGAVIIALTLFAWFAQSRLVMVMQTRGVGPAFAALAGLLLGAFSTSGPPMVAYFYAGDTDRIRAKANTQLYFASTTAVAIAIHAVAENVTWWTVTWGLPFIPVIYLATHLGVAVSFRVPLERFRILTDVALVGLGVALIGGNL